MRLALAAMAALLGGCTIGSGMGEADGNLYMLDCKGPGVHYCVGPKEAQVCGTADNPVPYQLRPRFFAGEPTEDARQGQRFNRLLIRLQRSGKRTELNDVLTFDITNSSAVARCVRGRTVAGVPDRDTRNCSWSSGVPRVRIGQDSDVRAAFVPATTCPSTPLATSGVSAVRVALATSSLRMDSDGLWESWIEFEDFGDAAQPSRPAEARDPISPRFKVDFEAQLKARAFTVRLEDSRVVYARREGDPPPTPEIGGSLTGNFDFDLERGQGAQTFP